MADPISLTVAGTALAGAAEGAGGGAAAAAAAGGASAGGIAGGGMLATLGGGILGAIGSIFSGGAKSNMYKYQAAVARVNKEISERNASYERYVGDMQSFQEGLKGRARTSGIITAQSGSGIDITRGSARGVQKSQQEINAFDEKMIETNAARRAYGYEVEAFNYSAQSNIDLMAASAAKTEGYIGAGSSLLGAGAKVAGQWLQAGQAFPSSGT